MNNQIIEVAMSGGIGNQLFQYSAGLSLSARLKAELVLDISWHHRSRGLSNFRTMELHRFVDLEGTGISTSRLNSKLRLAQRKIQNFAIDFAQERNITDPEIISSIYHSTMESFEKGIPGPNILKKLKTKYPKPKKGAVPPAPKIVPAEPIPPVDTIQAPTTTPTPRPGG
jgi:hypothetical protein